MLDISDRAKQKILESMDAKEAQGMALRIVIAGRGPMGFMYQLGFVPKSEAIPEDTVLEVDDLTVIIDPDSAENLEGASIKWVEDEFQRGFQIDNPNPLWQEPIALAVQEVIDSQINPSIMAHRGFVSLLDVKDGVAYIAFGGGCQGCGMADVTLKQGVEVKILEAVPEITQVLDTTDHGDGTNPFFQPGNRGQSPVE